MMEQICLEELTIRVMELERQMRAVHLDAQILSYLTPLDLVGGPT